MDQSSDATRVVAYRDNDNDNMSVVSDGSGGIGGRRRTLKREGRKKKSLKKRKIVKKKSLKKRKIGKKKSLKKRRVVKENS